MKIKLKIIIPILLLGILLLSGLLFASWQQAHSVRVLRLPHTMTADHPVHIAMEFMAERVREKSAGKMIIQIYPSGLLGDGTRIKELMQLGVVDIGKFSASDFEDNIPEMAAFCLPYLFNDAEHYWRVLSSPLGEEILNAGYDTKAQIKGLCFYDAGARSFYGKQPLNTEENLRGKKVRVMMSALMVAGIETLGAIPTSMAWGELFTALQTGTVDAAENNIPSFFTSKHYETCKHFSLSEHFRTPDVLAMSRKVWEALSDEERKILVDAAHESVNFQRKLWDKCSDEYIAELKKSGVIFSDVDQKILREKVKPLYEKQFSTARKELVETVKAIMAME